MDPTILALETATDTCGVALFRAGKILAELTLERPRAHAENLVPMVREALRLAGLSAPDLGAVALSMGPGSYTGLRIGTSTAKGLAMAADAALVGVPSLEALAAAALPFADAGDAVCAAFQARRDEVFAAAFLVGGDGVLHAAVETRAAAPAEVAGALPAAPRLWLAGDGAEAIAETIGEASSERLGSRIRLLDAALVRPSAARVARLGAERLALGEVEDLAAFEPFYLKAFVARRPRQSAFERLPF